MSFLIDPVGVLGLLLTFGSVVLFTHSSITLLQPRVLSRFRESEAENTERLRDLFLPTERARTLALLESVGVALLALLFFAASRSIVFTAAIVLAGYFAPRFIYRYVRMRRLAQVGEQLPDALDLMTSGARAGMNLGQAIRLAAEKAPLPIKDELSLIVNAMDLGESTEEALNRVRVRLSLPNIDLAATAILVSREKGGNLTTLLERISTSIREISRLEKKVKVETASIRFSARMMAAMPIVFGLILYAMDPPSIRGLFDTLIGNVLLLVVVLMTATGYLMIRRLANPDI